MSLSRCAQLVSCAFFGVVVLAVPALATSYTYTSIIDSRTSAFTQFGYGPSINDAGQVAFTANFGGVYVGSGGALTTIADSSGPLNTFFYDPIINNSGTVVFNANGDDFSTQIVKGSGGPLTVVAKADFGASMWSGYSFVNLTQPYINNNGQVIVPGNTYSGTSGVFVDTGGALALNYGYGTPFGRINESGQTSFLATKNASTVAVTRKDPGGAIHEFAVSDLSILSRPPDFLQVIDPRISLNNAGNVAFQAYRQDNTLIVLAYNGTTLVNMAQTSFDFDNAHYSQINGGPAISDGGVVVFSGTMFDPNDFQYPSRVGIFTGTNPITDAVIRQYDPLFGGYVSNLGFVSGVNAHGQIAFQYQLEDINGFIIGSGIGVATPSTSADIATTGAAAAQVGGGSGFIGGLDAEFSNVLDEGRFSSDYFSSPTEDELAVRIGQEAADEAYFDTPGAEIQTWNLHYSGEFSGGVELVFHYDEATLIVDESELVIRHFTGGEWVTPAQVIDTDANTITMTVYDFSPFILSSGPVAVPEAGTVSIMAIAAGVLMMRRRRTRCFINRA
jgi:hypothetical protein